MSRASKLSSGKIAGEQPECRRAAKVQTAKMLTAKVRTAKEFAAASGPGDYRTKRRGSRTHLCNVDNGPDDFKFVL